MSKCQWQGPDESSAQKLWEHTQLIVELKRCWSDIRTTLEEVDDMTWELEDRVLSVLRHDEHGLSK